MVRMEQPGEVGALARALLEAAAAVARVTDLDVDAAGVTVTKSQLIVLQQLTDHGPSAMLDLAAAVGVTGPTMTSTVRILVRKGLVERRHDEDDWRTVLVSATSTGAAALAGALASRAALVASAMLTLSSEQRAMLTVSLPALRALGARIQASTAKL